MDALILSCGTGGGHNSACIAIENELTARGHNVKTLNPYVLSGEKTACLVNNAYNKMVQRAPVAFGAVYAIGNTYRKLPFHSPVYFINGKMRTHVSKYLEENHFDVIITTHLFPAEILTNMKRHGYSVPKTVFIATDYICTPFTEETECDYYVIPSKELISNFCKRGIPKDRIYPLGIPVRKQFNKNSSKDEIKKSMGLSTNKKYILIAGGSIGAGKIEQVVSLLLKHYNNKSVGLIVICGNNKKLYNNINKNYKNEDSLYIIQNTPSMAEYMKACDVFISKPGGLSSTEAAVSNAALIHITPIPGCETYNMRFFERYGMCVAVSSLKTQLFSACDKLLAGEKSNNKSSNIIPLNATDAICDFIESKLKKI